MQLPNVLVTALSVLSATRYSAADVQPLANDSPETVYEADFSGKLDGHVKFSGLENGSIEIHVDLSGFPSAGGPFMYHVHEAPVPTNGDCMGTLAHLNPYHGNVNATNVDEKEISDLSGRYGMLNGDTEKSYVDQYLSLNPDSKAYIGGLSVTVHFANNSRLACANITEVSQHKSPEVSVSQGGAGFITYSAPVSILAAVMALLY